MGQPSGVHLFEKSVRGNQPRLEIARMETKFFRIRAMACSNPLSVYRVAAWIYSLIIGQPFSERGCPVYNLECLAGRQCSCRTVLAHADCSVSMFGVGAVVLHSRRVTH